jgi:hypothetical protein
MFGTKRQPKVPEMFANDLSYGRTEEQAEMSQAERPCPETTGGVEDWFPN